MLNRYFYEMVITVALLLWITVRQDLPTLFTFIFWLGTFAIAGFLVFAVPISRRKLAWSAVALMVFFGLFGGPTGHLVWYGWSHINHLGSHFMNFNMHAAGKVIQRGTTDGKELSHPQYIAVDMTDCGILLFPMSDPQTWYPEVGSRATVYLGTRETPCDLGFSEIFDKPIPAASFRVSS